MKTLVLTLIVSAFLMAIVAFAGDLPDSKVTPGATNPNVTQANIGSTICVPNWTGTVRPPASYTNKLKLQQLASPAFTNKDPTNYEEDHLIALALGGSPVSPLNLWPQSWYSEWNAHVKDRLEVLLHKKVCSGQMTLKEAQTLISTNWIAAYRRFLPQALPRGADNSTPVSK